MSEEKRILTESEQEYNLTEQQLKQIKYHLIGTITEDNKKVVNKSLRAIDKQIRKLKQC